MSDSGLMNHVKEVPQVGGGCGIVSQTTSTLIISPDSPSLNGSPEATSSGNPPFPTHEQQQIVESEVFTISTTALILDDNDVHSASPADTVSAAAPTSSSSPEFSTISTSTPPTLTTLSRWPTRADAVQAVATFMSYHGKRTFQSSKSCGGEVILLCTGNKGQGNCPVKIRIRRTKVKNAVSQTWYIPQNGLILDHSPDCASVPTSSTGGAAAKSPSSTQSLSPLNFNSSNNTAFMKPRSRSLEKQHQPPPPRNFLNNTHHAGSMSPDARYSAVYRSAPNHPHQNSVLQTANIPRLLLTPVNSSLASEHPPQPTPPPPFNSWTEESDKFLLRQLCMIVERKTRNANTGGGVRAVAASKQIGHRDWDIIALALNHNFQTNIFNMHIVGVRIGTLRERYQIWLSLHRDSRFTYSADTRKFYALAGVDAEAVWNEYTVDQGLEVEFFKWNPFLFETECEYLFGRVGGGGDDQSLSYSSVDQPPLTASSSVSSSLTYHHGSPREDGEDYAMPLVDGFPRFYRHHRRPQYTPASSSTDGVVSDMNSGGSRSHRRSFSSSAAAHYPSSPSTTTSSFIQHSLPNSPTSGMMMRIDPVRHRSASLAGDGSEIKGGIITTTSSSFTSARSFSSNVSLPSPQSISSYHSVPHQSSSSSSPLAMDFSSATISSSSLSSSSSSASLTHLASNSASSRSASSLSSPQISSLGRYRLAQILDETDTCDESSLAASTIVDVVSTTTAVTNSVGSLSSSLASAKTEEYDDYDDHYAEEEVAVNYESVFSSAASSALTDFAPRIKKYSSSLRLDTMSSIVKSLLEQVSAALVNTGDDDILGEVDSNGRNVISQTAASIPPPPPFMSSFIPTPTTGDADQLYVTSSGLPSYVPISPAAQPAVPSASGLTNMSMDTKAEIEPSAIKDVSKSESTNKKSITSLKRPWDARENNVDESMAAKFRNDQDSQDPMVNQQTSLYPTPLLKRVRIGLLDLQRELEAELN